jgi:hypothetical protein
MRREETKDRKPARKGSWAALLLSLVLFACTGDPLPREMVGIWVTDDPRYQGCTMEIAMDRITFGSPEKDADTYLIQTVSSRMKDGRREVTVEYVNAERVYFTAEWIYSAEKEGSLRFKNRPAVVWTLRKPGTAGVSGTTGVPLFAQGGA